MKQKTQRPRWLGPAKVLSLLLAAVLCVAGLTQAFAESELSPDNRLTLTSVSAEFIDGSTEHDGIKATECVYWEQQDGVVTGSVWSQEIASVKEYANFYMPVTATLSITNSTGEAFTLAFDWSTEDMYIQDGDPGGNVKVNGNSNRTGQFNKALGAGESITIEITSPKNTLSYRDGTTQGGTMITLSNFTITSAENTSVTLVSSADGSYTVTSGSSAKTTVNTSDVDQSYSYSFDSTKGITVKAEAKAGKRFYMWWDPTTKVPYSTEAEVCLFPSNGQTIQPVFVDENAYAKNFLVRHDNQDQYFVYWEDVMQMAAANQDYEKNVVLLTDYTLPEEVTGHTGTYVTADGSETTYSLPAGVTLVVPYDGTNDTSSTKTEKCETEPGQSTVFRKLTVPSGVQMKVPSAATLIVNAVQGAKNGAASMGRIVSDYGELEVNGKLDVTGTLYARGFVTGSGEVTANSSSKIYQLMQIQDWRGGSVTFGLYNYLMAINMYSFENIMADMTYRGGSQLLVQACIVAGGACVAVDVPVMTDGSGVRSIFVLDPQGQIETSYNKTNDQLTISMTKGKVTMQCLTLDMSQGKEGLMIDSQKYPLAVNDSMQIVVKDGATLQTDYKLKFLPGTSVTVEKGGTMVVAEGSELYFYSRVSYDTRYANSRERTRLNYDLIDRAGQTVKPAEDAKLDVYGTLEVYGTLMQSDDGAGGLEPHDGATIIMHNDPVTEGTVNECIGLGSTGNQQIGDDFYYNKVTNWCAIKGRMAEDATAYGGTDGFTQFAEKGTYNAVKIGETLYWYQYQVTYNYTLAEDASSVGTPTPEITYISKSTANHAVVSVGAQRFVAVVGAADDAKVTVTAGTASVNKNLTDGVEDVALANVTADTTVTLAVRPYTYKVTWEEYASAKATEANHTFAHYVTETTDSATWSGGPGLEIRSMVNAAEATINDTTKTVNVSGITDNATIRVNVDYTEYPVKVCIAVPGASLKSKGAQVGVDITGPKDYELNTNAEYLYSRTYTTTGTIQDGIEVTEDFAQMATLMRNLAKQYYLDFDGVEADGFYVIDQVKVAGSATVTPNFRGSTLLVSDVKSAVEVTVTLTHKDHKATFVLNENAPLQYQKAKTVGLTEDSLTASPAYFDTGELIELKSKDIQSESSSKYGTNFKYMFTGSTDNAATVTEDKLTFNTVGVTGDVTINASMTYYDFIATLKTTDGTVLKDIYMQDYVSDGDGKNTACRYNESIVTSGRAPLPYETAEKVTADGVSYMSYTYTFDKGEALNAIGSGLYEVTQEDYMEGQVAKTTPTLTVTAVNADATGQASITITAASYKDTTNDSQVAITENCVVTVDPVAYEHIVTFVDSSNNVLTKQYVAKDGTATYTAAKNQVVTEAKVTSDSGTGTVANNGTTVTVSGLDGNPTIKLTTAQYDSCVTWKITKDNQSYTVNQFIAVSGNKYTPVALLGDPVSGLAEITIDGSNAVLTAGDQLVVASGASYVRGSSSSDTLAQTAEIVTVPANATGTVSLELRGYDYTVQFVNDTTTEMRYVRKDKDVLTNYTVYYRAPGKTVITKYDANADSATVTGRSDESTDVADGWTVINLSNISENLTVNLTTASYDYKLQWTIKYPDSTSTTLQPRYVLTDTKGSYTAPDGYLIDKVVLSPDGTPEISEDNRTVTISGVDASSTSVTATVTLKSAVTHLITYSVNGEPNQFANPTDGTWTYKPDGNYEVTGAVVTGDSKVIVQNLRTKLVISGITTNPITVTITTSAKTTEPTEPEGEAVALWGDMSYQYYRCSTVYRWDNANQQGQWTPANTFAWRHSAGSRSYTVGGTSYTVPNGSILLLNNTKQAVTYTVQLVPTKADTDMVVEMYWTATGDQTNILKSGADFITVTVPAGQYIYVSGEMHTKAGVTTVPTNLTEENVGHITVGMATD